MKSHSRVVIVGGGILGVSVLYHLAREGWTDTVLIEKSELTSGSTWHAAGHCPLSSGSLPLTQIQKYSNELYPRLEALTNVPVTWHGCGGVRLATSDHEVDWFHYVYGLSRCANYEAHLISRNEIAAYHPFLDAFDVKLALLTVTDGHVAPADVTNAMASGARALGSTIHRRCRAVDVKRLSSGEWKVFTEAGDIICEHVINAAGSYAKVVASWTGHRAPIVNMLHHYVVTEPIDELSHRDPELPIVRDPYSCCYLRQEAGGLLVGPYEQEEARTLWDGGAPAWDFESELLAPELDRLTPWLAKAAERLPLFATAGIRSVISGAITHTPDTQPLLGPAAGPPGYWMANGAAIGIAHAGGAGKYLAQWIAHGAADISMREFDPRRFGDWASDDYTAKAAVEDYQNMFHCYRPSEQSAVGRPLRTSSLHEQLAAAGGQFEHVMGWERVRWFDRSKTGEDYSFRRSNWWKAVEAECLAVRRCVGLADLSSFAKFEVMGRDAHRLLNRLSANRLPRGDGRISLCHFLTNEGRIESEVTITRLAEEHYYVISAAAAQNHDQDVLHKNIASGANVTIEDVTDELGCLLLTGPNSRRLLSRVTNAELDAATFPWLTARTASIAGVHGVRLLRLTYTGELGWELHCRTADMPAILDSLTQAGRSHGLTLFGTYAMNSLRMEKAYRAWGVDLSNNVDMIEAGMERFVDFGHAFVGRDALLERQQRGPRTMLVYMMVDAVDSDCRGGEPVLFNDTVVGATTGGAYGFAVERSLTFAYVNPDFAELDKDLEVLLLGSRRAARIIPQPAYDPANLRLNA